MLSRTFAIVFVLLLAYEFKAIVESYYYNKPLLDSHAPLQLIQIYAAGVLGILLTIYLLIVNRLSLRDSDPAKRSYATAGKIALVTSDVISFLISYAVLGGSSASAHAELLPVLYLFFCILCIASFWVPLEHYFRRRPFWDELRETYRTLSIVMLFSGIALVLAKADVSRLNYFSTWAVLFALIPLGRSLIHHVLDRLGIWKLPAVIIGTRENAHESWLAIRDEFSMGYKLIGFVKVGSGGTAASSIEIESESFPVLEPTSIESLPSDVQIVVALESLADEADQIMVQRLVSRSRNVHLVPSIRGLPLFGTQLSHFFSHEVLLLTLRNNLARRGYKWVKRGFDLILASLLLLILSPAFLYLSSRIRRDGGKAFYGHTRVGQNGQAFKCLKFRSMRSDADKMLKDLLANDPVAKAEWDKDFKLKNDPRITSVGNFLRKTSLDELPQLINVIKGEMSLVGPRPIVTAELERYGDYVDLYLQVLPGMTGLWQVSGRNDTNYDQRVGLDSWYVQNWSLWYDIAILFKTVDVVLNRRGAY